MAAVPGNARRQGGRSTGFLGLKLALPSGEGVGRFPPPSTEKRTGARVVEWARLESVCGSNVTVGSNPTLSAITNKKGLLLTQLPHHQWSMILDPESATTFHKEFHKG